MTMSHRSATIAGVPLIALLDGTRVEAPTAQRENWAPIKSAGNKTDVPALWDANGRLSRHGEC